MKTNVIKSGILAALAIIMILAGSCKKEEMPLSSSGSPETGARASDWPDVSLKTGRMAIRLVNQGPGSFGAVNVQLEGLWVHYTNVLTGERGWYNMGIKSKIINLQEYTGDVALLVADRSALPVGSINGVRLFLGNENDMVWTDRLGLRHYTKLRLATEDRVINVAVNGNLNSDTKLYITVDFNAQASINYEGEETYILDPVVNLKSLDYE
jgi:hypothetical protein